MDSKTIKLPVIDFSGRDLKPGTPGWNSLKEDVRAAFEEFGCFKAIYDKIPKEVRQALYDSSAELFDLPSDTKQLINPERAYSGFIADGGGLYESTAVQKATIPEKVESFIDVMWPQGNSKFSNAILTYSQLLSELDKTVRRMIFDIFGLEKYVDEHIDSAGYVLRISKYKGPQTNDTKQVLQSHTDKNIVTIVDENRKGLEVRTKDGQWIELDFPPNTFLVICGEIFHALSNGRLYSPVHRVMISGNITRYSVGLFSNVQAGHMVKVPEELVDEEHPLRYKPFEISGLLAFYKTDAGHSESALQTYCGVCNQVAKTNNLPEVYSGIV